MFKLPCFFPAFLHRRLRLHCYHAEAVHSSAPAFPLFLRVQFAGLALHPFAVGKTQLVIDFRTAHLGATLGPLSCLCRCARLAPGSFPPSLCNAFSRSETTVAFAASGSARLVTQSQASSADVLL